MERKSMDNKCNKIFPTTLWPNGCSNDQFIIKQPKYIIIIFIENEVKMIYFGNHKFTFQGTHNIINFLNKMILVFGDWIVQESIIQENVMLKNNCPLKLLIWILVCSNFILWDRKYRKLEHDNMKWLRGRKQYQCLNNISKNDDYLYT